MMMMMLMIIIIMIKINIFVLVVVVVDDDDVENAFPLSNSTSKLCTLNLLKEGNGKN